MLGGLSGTIAATATMPLDYAKTTIQCGSGHQLGQVLSETLREQGPQGLFAGMVRLLPYAARLPGTNSVWNAVFVSRHVEQVQRKVLSSTRACQAAAGCDLWPDVCRVHVWPRQPSCQPPSLRCLNSGRHSLSQSSTEKLMMPF